MTGLPDARPPYLAAVLVALAILAGYVWTLAPSVTFWDAGEFIAAANILGIPHPPGTPLFILMTHVWGLLLPVGEYAWRTNLFSAILSAAGAGFWFLVAHETLRRATADTATPAAAIIRFGGAAAAAVIGAFAFTTWQNSNETEVYMVATLTIAATAWLALRWRAWRGSPRAARLLLLMVYLLGVSIGNHLLALLAGPGLLAFLVSELRLHPAADAEVRRREWAEIAVVAGVWALLIGMGLGNTTLVLVGVVAFAGAAVLAVRGRVAGFAMVTLAVALVGITPYLYLFLRAAQAPMINEADPSTWEALLDVIRRAQYPVRTPLDNPTQVHGPGNSGRSLELIGLQLANYWQYFDWQWARSIAAQVGDFPLRTLVTLGFVSLGIQGARTQYRADRSSFWLIAGVWLATGLGLVAYMNFKPGFSIGYDQFPEMQDHEVRERDYFFVASFVTWGVWAGLGLARAAAAAVTRLALAPRAVASAVLAVALVPVLLNAGPASRRHGPDATLAADFAWNLLNSVPPYGILFTYGDNDTFPLWWAQEVEGIRQDVTVICLALAETPWYMRQLRDNPIRAFNPDRAAEIWRDWPAERPDWPVHTMTDADIESAVPQLIPVESEIAFGPYRVVVPAQTPFYGKDFLSVRVAQQNFGRRPIAWAVTAGGEYQGLDPLLVQRGLAIWVENAPPDTTAAHLDFHPSGGPPLDLAMTEELVVSAYRYGDLMARGPGNLDPTARSIAGTMAIPFTQLAGVAERRGEYAAMANWLQSATRLSDSEGLRAALREALTRLPSSGQ
ncbi:MAG: DUF2723 domain-containing protein [Gemmatimonadales bacterium]